MMILSVIYDLLPFETKICMYNLVQLEGNLEQMQERVCYMRCVMKMLQMSEIEGSNSVKAQ